MAESEKLQTFGRLVLHGTGQGFAIFCITAVLDFICRSEVLVNAGLSVFQNLAWLLIFGLIASIGWGVFTAVSGITLSKLPGLKRYSVETLGSFFSYALFVYVNLVYLRLYLMILQKYTIGEMHKPILVGLPLLLLLYPLSRKHELSKTLRGAYAPLGKCVPGILVVCLLLPLAGGRSRSNDRTSDKPNIVMITIDSLTAQHMSLYGYPRKTTPNLEEFAQTSLVFDHAIANSNGTHIGLPCFLGNLPFEPVLQAKPKPLLSRILVALGYDCSFISFKILDPAFRRTFQRSVYLTEVASAPWYKATFGRFSSRGIDQIWLSAFLSEDYRTWNIFGHLQPREFDAAPGRAFPTEANLDFILNELEAGGSPKFLWTHLFSVHYPRPVIPEYKSFFTDLPPGDPERPVEQVEAINQYDDAVAEIDHQIGRFLQELKAKGLDKDTMIVIGSDHGESLFYSEAGILRYMHSGNWLNEQVSHVPLLIRLPDQTEGQRIQTFVQHLDVAPTILDVLGEKIPEQWTGRSVLPFRKDPEAFREDLIIAIPESFFQRGFTRLAKPPSWNWVGVKSDMIAVYKDPYKIGWLQTYEEDEQMGRNFLTKYKDIRIYGIYNVRKDPGLTNKLPLQELPSDIVDGRIASSELARRYRSPMKNGEL